MEIPTLRASVARRNITPEIGTPLFGYGNQRLAQTVDDGLNVTVLYLESDDCSSCILSLDWCYIDEIEVANLRALISQAIKIAPENVIIHATHTHSGPITMDCWGLGWRDEKYLEFARPRIVEAVVEAGSTPVAVRVGIGTIHTDIGVNRCEVDVEGNIQLGFNEWGPRDRDMTIVRFERAADDQAGSTPGTLATVVHAGAHPTARGDDPAISRDWPGVMMDRVEQLTGAPVVFLNGAFGNVAPRTTIGGPSGDADKASREVGLRAALHAMQAWREIKEFRDLDLQTSHATFVLPFADLPSREVAEAQFAQYAGQENATGEGEAEWRYWNAVLQAHDGPPQTAREWSQSITRLGPIVFVPFAGEIFSEICLRLKQASPFAHTLCLGTTNGTHGYYVTREALTRNCHEVWFNKTICAHLLAANNDDVLVQENLKLLQALQTAELRA
jgi:hypothetical protein